MQRVRVAEPGRVELTDVPEPEPGPGELLLQLHSAGICGGDVSLVRGTNAIARYPAVPGHECVAEILSVPPGSDLRPGQHVVVYPTLSCGECRSCDAGATNQCARMTVLGLSAPGGCFAERFTLTEQQCVVLPEGMEKHYGALIEPVAVACHVVERGQVRTDDCALVIGSGAIGLATALVARARGVRRVLFADVEANRRRVVQALGFADFTCARGDDLVSWVDDVVGRVDLVYDTVTTSETAAVGAEVLEGGGRYVAIASAKPGHRVEVPYDRFYARELSFVASRNYRRADFDAAVRLIEAGAVDPRPMRTAVYPLSGVESAIAELVDRPDRNIKVLITRPELMGSAPLLSGDVR